MIRGIAAVAWDIDGTLIDSEPLHQRCLVDTCLGYGLDLRGDPPERFVGVHVEDVWAELAPALPRNLGRDDWMHAIHDLYCAHVAEAPPIDGALEITRALAEADVRQIAVSNSTRRIVDANLAMLDVGGLMEASISLDDVRRGKPDPEPYLRALASLGLPGERVLAIEDSLTGARSAWTAGLRLAGLGDAGRAPGATPLAGLRALPALLGL